MSKKRSVKRDEEKFYDAWDDGERHKKTKGQEKKRGSMKQNFKNEIKSGNYTFFDTE